jgi:hypothetical protein
MKIWVLLIVLWVGLSKLDAIMVDIEDDLNDAADLMESIDLAVDVIKPINLEGELDAEIEPIDLKKSSRRKPVAFMAMDESFGKSSFAKSNRNRLGVSGGLVRSGGIRRPSGGSRPGSKPCPPRPGPKRRTRRPGPPRPVPRPRTKRPDPPRPNPIRTRKPVPPRPVPRPRTRKPDPPRPNPPKTRRPDPPRPNPPRTRRPAPPQPRPNPNEGGGRPQNGDDYPNPNPNPGPLNGGGIDPNTGTGTRTGPSINLGGIIINVPPIQIGGNNQQTGGQQTGGQPAPYPDQPPGPNGNPRPLPDNNGNQQPLPDNNGNQQPNNNAQSVTDDPMQLLNKFIDNAIEARNSTESSTDQPTT